MKKNILAEINRMHEIMGLGLLQEQNLEIGQIITDKGEKKKIVDIIPKTLQDIIVPQEFEAGATELTPATTTKLDTTIQELIDFLATPYLRDVNWKISINAGASQIPVGNTLAQKLGLTSTDPFVGRNEELAELRAKAVSDYFKEKLNTAGITNIEFPEAIIKIGVTDWETNKDAYKNKDAAILEKFKKEQFMNLSLGAAGIEVQLADLPKICGKKMEKSGTRAKVTTLGAESGGSLPYATYPDNEGKGFAVDLGLNTEGIITFTFDSYTIPDMFQLTYNEETFTSSGPGGREGFVSNRFDNCDEGSPCANVFTREISKLEKELNKSTKKTDKAAEKVDDAYNKTVRLSPKYVRILQIENKVETPSNVDLAWFEKFFELFPPADKNWWKRNISMRGERNLKYNPKLKGGYARYRANEDTDGNVIGYEGRGDYEDGKELWEYIIDKWATLDEKFDDKTDDFEEKKENTSGLTSTTEKQIADLKKALADLQSTGQSSDYTTEMTEILTSDPYNFPYGVIGDQGKIVIDKIKDVQYAYIQVFAPLSGTEWECNITCKEKGTA